MGRGCHRVLELTPARQATILYQKKVTRRQIRGIRLGFRWCMGECTQCWNGILSNVEQDLPPLLSALNDTLTSASRIPVPLWWWQCEDQLSWCNQQQKAATAAVQPVNLHACLACSSNLLEMISWLVQTGGEFDAEQSTAKATATAPDWAGLLQHARVPFSILSFPFPISLLFSCVVRSLDAKLQVASLNHLSFVKKGLNNWSSISSLTLESPNSVISSLLEKD